MQLNLAQFLAALQQAALLLGRRFGNLLALKFPAHGNGVGHCHFQLGDH
ncbi:hypothetical protein [Massilia frigida]|nr:hypothetical protein [Massilia frigida]